MSKNILKTIANLSHDEISRLEDYVANLKVEILNLTGEGFSLDVFIYLRHYYFNIGNIDNYANQTEYKIADNELLFEKIREYINIKTKLLFPMSELMFIPVHSGWILIETKDFGVDWFVELYADEADMPRMIGKKGNNIVYIRNFVNKNLSDCGIKPVRCQSIKVLGWRRV